MSLALYFWDAVTHLVQYIGGLKDHDTSQVKNTDPNPTCSLPSADLQHTLEQDYLADSTHTETAASFEREHSDAIQEFESNDANAEDVTISEESGPESNDDTNSRDQKDELQQESSEKDTVKIITRRIDRDLNGQNQISQHDNVLHLIWQDRASMTIKTLKEDVEARKHKARVAKKVAVRAKAAMQRQIDDLKRQVDVSERANQRGPEENARATEAHESNLQETKNELEAQKEAAEQAAAAAERQITEMQTKHKEDMSAADAKVNDLRAAQTFTFDCHREANELREQLSQAREEKKKDLAAKDEEIKKLQTCVDDRESETRRLRAKAESGRGAKRQAAREENTLMHAKLKADREVEKLKEENESLNLERQQAYSRALGAEGRAKGLQDQLMVTSKRAEQWETLYTKTEENARNEVLSAYTVVPAPVSEDQQTITTSSKEEESRVLVENLRNEHSELEGKIGCLTAEIAAWRRAWEEAVKNQETWEEGIRRWEVDVRRQYDEEKRKALATERAKGRMPSEQDAREQYVPRQCDEEKQKALAVERESCRVQRGSRECSLRGQFASKLKSHTRELQKLRSRAGIEHKKQMKVKKCQGKWEFRRAVSRAVDVERSLLQRQLQTQFQTELSNYKTQLESEHGNPRIQTEARGDTDSKNQVLLNEEIKKRDGYIEKAKARLKEAFDAKRESEHSLKLAKEENERLSRDAIAYESQKAMARQTKSEAQIALVMQELVRALKLFTEIATLGLDEKHRNLLNELVLANKVVRDIRSRIEEDIPVDYEEFQSMLDRVVASSDAFDTLDPRERPALHAQLSGTYALIGGLARILASKRGDTTKQQILERIYRDSDKGKGKEGALIGSGVASGPSFGVNSGVSAAPLPQPNGNRPFTSDPNDNLQTGFSNASTSKSTQDPAACPFTTTLKPDTAGSQDEPKYIDPATVHTLQGSDDMNEGASDYIDLDAIDWSDPAWLNFNP
ncbi:MAG: hypothetical protein Q9175_006789 [Cornicularia normoerica]